MGILPTVNPTFTQTTAGAITSKVIIANMGCGLVALLSFDSRHSSPESRSSQRVSGAIQRLRTAKLDPAICWPDLDTFGLCQLSFQFDDLGVNHVRRQFVDGLK